MFTLNLSRLGFSLTRLTQHFLEPPPEAEASVYKKRLGLATIIAFEAILLLLMVGTVSKQIRLIEQAARESREAVFRGRQIEKNYETITKSPKLTEEIIESLTMAQASGGLVEDFSLWSGENNLTLEGIVFSSPQASSRANLWERPVTLNLSGPYEGLLSFLIRVRDQKPSLVLNKLRLSQAKNGANDQVSVELSLVNYYSQNPASP